MRIVLDTNVVISGVIIKGSVSNLALKKAREEHQLLCSLNTMHELSTRLKLPKFQKYTLLSDRMAFFAKLVAEMEIIVPGEKVEASRDKDDNMLLELAIAGKADCIVSGDSHLRELHPFRGIPIVSPRQFIDNY